MVLNDKQIEQAVKTSAIVIDPFDSSSLEPASYDLHVGQWGITTKRREKYDIKNRGFIEIAAGDFALILSKEVLRLDLQHVARFGLCSKFARDGLVATVGTQIDPGFHGRLKVGLVNMSTRTISLGYDEHFLTVEFHRLESPASRGYSGTYQNQLDLVAEDFNQIVSQGGHAFSDSFESLKELTQKVSDLTTQISHLAKHTDERYEQISRQMNHGHWIIGSILAIAALLITVVPLLKP